jgi:hypothetical protein
MCSCRSKQPEAYSYSGLWQAPKRALKRRLEHAYLVPVSLMAAFLMLAFGPVGNRARAQ